MLIAENHDGLHPAIRLLLADERLEQLVPAEFLLLVLVGEVEVVQDYEHDH